MIKITHPKCQDCHFKYEGIFCALDTIELEYISQQKIMKKYKLGQPLFEQGASFDGIYCVNKGSVQLTKIGADGKEIMLDTHYGGKALGYEYLLNNCVYNAKAVAMEDTEVCFFDKNFVLNIKEKRLNVIYNLLEGILLLLKKIMTPQWTDFTSIARKNSNPVCMTKE